MIFLRFWPFQPHFRTNFFLTKTCIGTEANDKISLNEFSLNQPLDLTIIVFQQHTCTFSLSFHQVLELLSQELLLGM